MQVLSHESISTVLRMSRDLERNQEATCYIGNLDERVTDEIVWELMLQAGPIAHVYLPKDRISQMHQGYAFAEYQTKGDAEYSCRILNGIKLYGKPIRVNLSSNEKQEVDIGANLFVGSLEVLLERLGSRVIQPLTCRKTMDSYLSILSRQQTLQSNR